MPKNTYEETSVKHSNISPSTQEVHEISELRIKQCKKLLILNWNKYNKLCWLLKILLDTNKGESNNDPVFILGLSFRILVYKYYYWG